MTMIGCFCFTLGVLMTSAAADDMTTGAESLTVTPDINDLFHSNDTDILTIAPDHVNTIGNSTGTTADPNSTSEWKRSNSTSVKPLTTGQKRDVTTSSKGSLKPTRVATAPNPKVPKSTASQKITPAPNTSADMTGVVILLIIIVLAIVSAAACLLIRRKERTYSIDLTSRQDDPNIPLSTVETEMPPVFVGQNGLQTADDKEPDSNEPKEEKEKPEVQEEQKTEADKPVVEPSAESAAPAPAPSPAPSPEESENKPTNSPAPVGQSAEENIDDDGSISNQTSVESLKETNENNSNSVNRGLITDMESNFIFWEVPLHHPE